MEHQNGPLVMSPILSAQMLAFKEEEINFQSFVTFTVTLSNLM